MFIDKITYSESVETMNASGNKKWFKSSVEIADVNDETTKATSIAKDYVSATINQSIEDNSSYLVDPATFYSETRFTKATDFSRKNQAPEYSQADKEMEKEFEDIKQKITKAKTKEDAQSILTQSHWALNVELKKIVNSK